MGNVYTNLYFSTFFVLELRACTGQTDGRTDGPARLIIRPTGGPHDKPQETANKDITGINSTIKLLEIVHTKRSP